MKELLVVVDMQNDFVTAALGTEEAVKIVGNVAEKVREAREKGADLVFTMDTHGRDYLETQEGRNLPVPHCIKGTEGWKIIPELQDETGDGVVLEKPSFGSAELADLAKERGYAKIRLIGVCTDICVITNALLLKTALPEAKISVDASCCAGVTPQSHKNALEAMKMCQIQIENN